MKNSFLIICLFAIINCCHAQMIIHGTTATHFYIWQNGSAKSIFASEMWDKYPNPYSTTWNNDKVYITTPTWQVPIPIGSTAPVEFMPDGDGHIFLSCNAAKSAFGSMYVTCGPYSEPLGSNGKPIMTCGNHPSSPACKIYTSNTIYWSDNGHFFE